MPVTATAAAFISTAPTRARERKAAAAAAVVSSVGFCLVAPFAQVQLAAVSAFIPLNQAAFFISDLITAILLLAQVPHVRSRALVILAFGYVFDALMIVPHTLTFPGLFSPLGLLGAGEQSTAWIYMFWHSGFPLFVIVYAVTRGHPKHDRLPASFWKTMTGASFGIVLLVSVFTLLATAGQELLPPVMSGNYYTPYARIFTAATWLFSVVALVVLYRRRRASALDLWLAVVMLAWVFDVALSAVLNHGRFDLGFYAGRVYGLIAASFVLIALLVESSYLYARVQQSQEQLAQAQKMEAMGMLTGGIAHDFNNLLAVIQANIELLEHQFGPVEHGHLVRLLGPAKRAVESGVSLTRDLLAFARQETMGATNIDINRLVGKTSDLLGRTLGAAIRIETVLSEIPCRCSVEPSQLENALLNLAVNARDAMPQGGALTIETGIVDLVNGTAAALAIPPGRYAAISVSDTGTGMPADVQSHAFEPFYTTKGPEHGTGLGLSQVYGFVSRSGGYVRLVSKPGQGTTVRMYLPIVSDGEEGEEPAQTTSSVLPRRIERAAASEWSSPAERNKTDVQIGAEAAA